MSNIAKGPMKDGRPVNLDISTMCLPITAWSSISHRISGVLIIPMLSFFLWALQVSLESEASFEALKIYLQAPIIKSGIWLMLTVYTYHLLAGVKHLIMDLGFGESFEAGVIGAKILFSCTGVCFGLIGFWLW